MSLGAFGPFARRFKFGSRSGPVNAAPEITQSDGGDHDAIFENCSNEADPVRRFPVTIGLVSCLLGKRCEGLVVACRT